MSGPDGVLGLLLAAGAGRRMGTPKALLRDEFGTPFVARAIGVLLGGGCDSVLVVTGASSPEVAVMLEETGWLDDPAVEMVFAEDWDEGMGSSLSRGLDSALGSNADCALVMLVDLHDVGAPVVRRLVQQSGGPTTLLRATYDGVPGHPVLLGREHWAVVIESAEGDKGARDYLAANPHERVECGDLATGRDTDTPEDLTR